MGFSSIFRPYQNSSSPSSYDVDESHNYNYNYIYSSSVDCTLSLGTPSTRLTTHEATSQPRRNSVSSFSWDSTKPYPNPAADARRCANCDTTSTPLWRNGPRGPKSLCNACGIRYKKEERRVAAATTRTTDMEPASQNDYYNGSWMTQPYGQGDGPQKMQFYGGNETDSSAGIQFLSWLAHDRPTTLVHHFTR